MSNEVNITIIPARPGYYLLYVSDAGVGKEPIIAWRTYSSTDIGAYVVLVDPVTLDPSVNIMHKSGRGEVVVWGILSPDGTVRAERGELHPDGTVHTHGVLYLDEDAFRGDNHETKERYKIVRNKVGGACNE
jgi:hypothetical protein